MFADARSVATDTTLEADLCIVGAGAAGITLARAFSGSPVRVVVLESGDMEFDGDTQALYDGPSVGLPYPSLSTPRLRYFGGTTNHWGGICRPFEDEDFEARDGIPFTGWPIRRTDVASFYPEAARICGVTSEEWDVEDWVRRHEFSPLPLEGTAIVNRVAQVVPRDVRSFGDVYSDELRRSGNVTVYLNGNVTGIETDRAGRRVTSVRAATLSGNRFSVQARAFVVAAGAIENARLLLVSNERWPRGLGNSHDLVGRFFSEHPRFVGGVIVPSDPHISVGFYELNVVDGAILQGYLALSKEVQLSEGFLDLQIRVEPVYSGAIADTVTTPSVVSAKRLARGARRGQAIPDFGRHVGTVAADLITWQRFTIPGAPVPVPYPEVLAKVLGSSRREAEELMPLLVGNVATRGYVDLVGGPLERIDLATRIEQAPNRDSRVLLTDDRDELQMPRVALDWRMSDVDRRVVRRALGLLGAEVGASGIGRLQILLGEDDRGWPEDLKGGSHHTGTTRMSDDARQGVVDRDGLVHGMANLFVAGSSVFPTAGGGTPTLLLVALALRLADHLRTAVL